MDSPVTVRPARIEDVPAMARVLVRSWQETYRGLMPDRVLDDPGLVGVRERSGPLPSSTSDTARTGSRWLNATAR